MDPWSLQQAQKSLDQLLECKNPRCVYDFFAQDLSKNSREDIYIFIKDHSPVKIVRECAEQEKPLKMLKQEKCFMLKLKKQDEVQILWRNENGQWKLSNAAKRKI